MQISLLYLGAILLLRSVKGLLSIEDHPHGVRNIAKLKDRSLSMISVDLFRKYA